MKRNRLALFSAGLAGLTGLSLATAAAAATPVTILANRIPHHGVPSARIASELGTYFDLDSYRAVKAQPIYDANGHPDHLLVYLFQKGQHRVELAKVTLGDHYELQAVERDYHLQPADTQQQPGLAVQNIRCPDDTVEFLAVAPNDDQLELDITRDVAAAAKAKGLVTVELLTTQATRQNYLSYMTCPNLRGNFYDGDADPELITTSDGVISADDLQAALTHKFAYKVTNIWLACEAFNDPMLSTMIDQVQSRKYAAGINDLEVGPSDRAAACAMKDALDGQPMTAAFQSCKDQLDSGEDQWGFDGHGSDNFWD